MVGAGRKKALLISFFSRILNGEALEWFAFQELKSGLNRLLYPGILPMYLPTIKRFFLTNIL